MIEPTHQKKLQANLVRLDAALHAVVDTEQCLDRLTNAEEEAADLAKTPEGRAALQKVTEEFRKQLREAKQLFSTILEQRKKILGREISTVRDELMNRPLTKTWAEIRRKAGYG